MKLLWCQSRVTRSSYSSSNSGVRSGNRYWAYSSVRPSQPFGSWFMTTFEQLEKILLFAFKLLSLPSNPQFPNWINEEFFMPSRDKMRVHSNLSSCSSSSDEEIPHEIHCHAAWIARDRKMISFPAGVAETLFCSKKTLKSRKRVEKSYLWISKLLYFPQPSSAFVVVPATKS